MSLESGGGTLESESVSRWIQQLNDGNQEAAFRLWNRYGFALERLAKCRFGLALNAAFDEQDLAQSVFLALWQNAEAGRLEDVRDRTELWWVLLEITRRRALARLKYNDAQKRRPPGAVQKMSKQDSEAGDPLQHLEDQRELPPEVLVILNDEYERLMSVLRDDLLRTIAGFKLEGYTVEEIAGLVNLSQRTIVRKLNLIRECWGRELHND